MNHIAQIDLIRSTPQPQNLSALAMHNDYSEKYVLDEPSWLTLDETEAGNRIVDHCLKKGHFGIIEHTYFTFGVKGAPHSVMQQLRTHRHLTFDVQSFRYSGKRYREWYERNRHTGLTNDSSLKELEELQYLRLTGQYKDRVGGSIYWSETKRVKALKQLALYLGSLVDMYLMSKTNSMPYEMFRDFLPAGYRQNFIVSGNLRAFLHLFDMRLPQDVQLECRYVVTKMAELLDLVCPEIMKYYNKQRAGKNKLAP